MWSNSVARSTCAKVAQSLLILQQDIRSKNSVVDSLWINLSQSYHAAVILCEHLIIQSPQTDYEESTTDNRSTFFELINEAVSALLQIASKDSTALQCAKIIQMLLQHVRKSKSLNNTSSPSLDIESLERSVWRIRKTVLSSDKSSTLNMQHNDSERYQTPNSTPLLRSVVTPNGLDISLKYGSTSSQNPAQVDSLSGNHIPARSTDELTFSSSFPLVDHTTTMQTNGNDAIESETLLNSLMTTDDGNSGSIDTSLVTHSSQDNDTSMDELWQWMLTQSEMIYKGNEQ